MATRPNDFPSTRRSLLSRLKNWDDQESWREFFDTYGWLLHRVARKAGLTEEEAEDAVQETVIAVARTMPGFKYDPGRCAFKTWLHRLTRGCIADQFRKRRRRRRSEASGEPLDGSSPSLEEIPDPAGPALDAIWDEEFEAALADAALERVKQKVSPELFQVFELYVLRGLPVREVARLLHVSAAKIYVVKHRIGRLIQAEVRALREKGI
jgi:RNA polymerase sigma-70 factor (ECF subfamily)